MTSDHSRREPIADADMDGKVIVITGGASGIGRASAARFLRAGGTVIVVDIDTRLGGETVDSIDVEGRCSFLEADVGDVLSIRRLAGTIRNTYGRVDILVNSAAVAVAAPFRETTLEQFQRTIDVNLRGVFLVSQSILPLMAAGGGGAIVNVASNGGPFIGLRDLSAYCAAKAGVVGLTRAMALELSSEGIRINAVCPGPVDTPMLARAVEAGPQNTMQAIAESTAIRRIAEPSEIAEVIYFLASPSSSFVTGSAVVVDGGQMIL